MNNPNPQKDSRDPPRSPPPETLISTSRCTRDRVFSGKSGNPGKTSGFLPQFSPGQTWNRRNDGMGSTPIVQKILAIAIVQLRIPRAGHVVRVRWLSRKNPRRIRTGSEPHAVAPAKAGVQDSMEILDSCPGLHRGKLGIAGMTVIVSSRPSG
jgi:hypothetical protein